MVSNNEVNSKWNSSSNAAQNNVVFGEEGEIELDADMLEEYKEWLTELGFFPDKVQINSLTIVAEDHASSPSSASLLYQCIRDMLVSPQVHPGRKLPLVYVIDSILKNARGAFVPLIEEGAKQWMSTVYQALHGRDTERVKLKKVLSTWQEFGIFKVESVKEISKGIEEMDQASNSVVPGVQGVTAASLKQLSLPLRKQMQALLDDMQRDNDELDKVSLERLAMINPSLIDNIKQAAMDMLQQQGAGGIMVGCGAAAGKNDVEGGTPSSPTGVASIVPDIRPIHEIKRSAEWEKVDFTLDSARDIVGSLQRLVREGTSHIRADSPSVSILVAASVTSHHITGMMQKMQLDGKKKKTRQDPFMYPSRISLTGTGKSPTQKHVDKSLFTTEGLKGKDDWVISRLYEQGLPFVSSSDGRRFSTQKELSNHLDELFRKAQAEKTMERTEERGWYPKSSTWTGSISAVGALESNNRNAVGGDVSPDEATSSSSPEALSTVLADEERSKCAICGISFNMFFDQEEGEWMYSNCREVQVLRQQQGSSDLMLVHVTCLRALGTPDRLTWDQVLQY